jgi:SEC-C motif-containing protein
MNKSNKNSESGCICGSGLAFTGCCLPLVDGHKSATSAEQLMRSRYTAYALGRADYILDSWHRRTQPAQIDLDDSIKWCGLRVISVSREKNNTAYVEFVAEFKGAGHNSGQMHERSRFLFEQSRWFYMDGEQITSTTQHRVSRPGRNDACYCGSGKKFKKCCEMKN